MTDSLSAAQAEAEMRTVVEDVVVMRLLLWFGRLRMKVRSKLRLRSWFEKLS